MFIKWQSTFLQRQIDAQRCVSFSAKKGMMKGFRYVYPSLLLAILVLAIIVFANPTVDYQSPSEPDSIRLSRNYTFINISTNDSAADYIILEWNGTNVTIDDPSLVLNMHFDENSTASGGIKDSSRYGNNGTNTGGANFTLSGKFGSAYAFSKVDELISLGNPNSLAITGNKNLTITAWVKTAVAGDGNTAIFMRGINAGYGYQRPFGLYFSGTSFYGLLNNASENTQTISGSGDYTDGSWHFAAFVVNDTKLSLYADGASIATPVTRTVFDIGTGDSNSIAKDTTYLTYFNGSVDELKVWSRALTAQEINAAYKSEYGRYNTTQFFANMTDLNAGQYSYVTIINNTAGALNRSQARIVSVGGFAVDFLSPSETNNTYLNRNYTFLNISSNDPNIDSAIVEWNGTNVTIDSPSLVLNMHFDENSTASGGIKDKSRYGNNGTAYSNSVSFTNSGKFGTGWTFNRTGKITTVSQTKNFANNSKTTTWSSWVYPFTGTGVIVSKSGNSGGSNGQYTMRITSTNLAVDIVDLAGTYETFQLSSQSLTLNAWNFVGFIFDNSTGTPKINLVLNAVNQSFTPTKIPERDSDRSIVIGSYDDMSNGFNGTIDEVRIWNRSLTLSELNASRNSEFGRYNTTQFFANLTGLNDGQYRYAVIMNNTAGALNRSQERIVNVERWCGIPDTGAWTITSRECNFAGRNLTMNRNLTLTGGANLTLAHTNITFNETNQYIIVYSKSSFTVGSGSKIGK